VSVSRNLLLRLSKNGILKNKDAQIKMRKVRDKYTACFLVF
jgi:hypothetical protein